MSPTTESRADQVRGLKNELAYLERQPHPNEGRIRDVKKQLDRFKDEPEQRTRETAANTADPEANAGVSVEHDVDARRAAESGGKAQAKKSAAAKAPAKRSPAKKAAAKKSASSGT